MSQIPLFFTAQDMSEDFMKRLREGFKGDCPCCGRHAQVYKRRLHWTIVRFLIEFYRVGGGADFIYYGDVVRSLKGGSIGDFTKAKYWDLIESAPSEKDEGQGSGFWKLTQLGIDFIRGEVELPAYVLVFADQLIGQSEETVGVREALDEKFDYQQLMGA